MNEEKVKDLLSFFTQSRAEAVSFVVALAVGIFSILIIFNDVTRYSFAWFALSIAYWAIVVLGIIVYFGVLVNIFAVNHLVRKFHAEYDEYIEEILTDNKRMKKIFQDLIKDPDSKRISITTWVFFAVIVLVSGLLWFTLAYDLTDKSVFETNYDYFLKKFT